MRQRQDEQTQREKIAIVAASKREQERKYEVDKLIEQETLRREAEEADCFTRCKTIVGDTILTSRIYLCFFAMRGMLRDCIKQSVGHTHRERIVFVIDVGSAIDQGDCRCSDEMATQFLQIIHDARTMWTMFREMSEYVEVVHPDGRVMTRVMHGCTPDERVLGLVAPSVAHVDVKCMAHMNLVQQRNRHLRSPTDVRISAYMAAVEEAESARKQDEEQCMSVIQMKVCSVRFVHEDELPDIIQPVSVSIVKDIQCTIRAPSSHATWVISVRWKWTRPTYEEAEAALLTVAPTVTLRMVRTGLEFVSQSDVDAEVKEVLSRLCVFLYCGPYAQSFASSVIVPCAQSAHLGKMFHEGM